jgi:hypothetical protein
MGGFLKVDPEISDVGERIHAIDLLAFPQRVDALEVSLLALPPDSINYSHHGLARKSNVCHLFDFSHCIRKFRSRGIESLRRNNDGRLLC